MKQPQRTRPYNITSYYSASRRSNITCCSPFVLWLWKHHYSCSTQKIKSHHRLASSISYHLITFDSVSHSHLHLTLCFRNVRVCPVLAQDRRLIRTWCIWGWDWVNGSKDSRVKTPAKRYLVARACLSVHLFTSIQRSTCFRKHRHTHTHTHGCMSKSTGKQRVSKCRGEKEQSKEWLTVFSPTYWPWCSWASDGESEPKEWQGENKTVQNNNSNNKVGKNSDAENSNKGLFPQFRPR